MATQNVTAQELLILDKKRFDKEYWSWVEHTADYGWWEFVYADFEDQCDAMHITVEDITFSGFCSQGDGAAFAGRIYLTAFMERHGLDVQYPALYIGVKNDGSYLWVRHDRGNCMRCGAYENYAVQTAPEGVFAGLEQEAWEELIEEQERDAGLEDLALQEAEALADQLYIDLEAEYDHLTSEESFLEHCDCNDITFDIETETEESEEEPS